jgi:hypothetical protein
MKRVILVFITAWFVLSSSNMKEEYIDISDQCIFKVDIASACFQLFQASTNEVIIKNELEYQDFMNSNRSKNTKDCIHAKLPYVDFNRYMLIGKKTSGTTCKATSNYFVSVDYKNRNVKYTIDLDYSGNCSMKVMSWNFACIPKVLDYYTIHFEVVER